MAKNASRYRRRHDRTHPRGWFNLFLRLGGWVCLLAGAGLLVLTFVSAIALRVADRIDAKAGYAVATITGKSVLGDRENPEARMVTFTYKTPLRGGQTAETKVDADFFARVTVGSEYPIRYLKDDPSRVEMEPVQSRRAGAVLRWIAFALGLLGLYALWRFGSQTNAAILARRDGEKRLAKVVAVNPTGVEINGRPQGRILWREDDGQAGESLMRDLGRLKQHYDPGDSIVVFRRGKDAVWEGDVGPPRREVVGDGSGSS